ncbi:MAG: hypothetical protein EOO40_00925 [Deltaproteobacteria bacterium]|nr:MAG: hypothetical protein EOO40_00925 [Deltaproteobacteria bacterium]
MSGLASGAINAGGQFLGVANASGLLTELTGQVGRVQFVRPGIGCVLQFDACLNEAHSRTSEPTNNPVEDGSVISDHIIVTPFELSFTGIITDDPLYASGNDISGKPDATKLVTTAVGTAASGLISPLGIITEAAAYAAYTAHQHSEKRSVLAYRALTKLQAGDNNSTPATLPTPFTVLTRYARYTNMVVKSLAFPRDATTSSVCVFTVSLAQINVVAPQVVALSALKNPALGSDLKDVGEQDTLISDAEKAFNASKAKGEANAQTVSDVAKKVGSVVGLGG